MARPEANIEIRKYVAIAVTMGWDKEKNTVYVFIPSSRLSVCGSCVPHTRNVLFGSCADTQIRYMHIMMRIRLHHDHTVTVELGTSESLPSQVSSDHDRGVFGQIAPHSQKY